MAHRFFRIVAVLTSAAVASLWFAASTQAASPAQASTRAAGPRSAIAVGKQYQAEIKLLDPFVSTNADGTLSLAAPHSVMQRVDSGHMQALLAGLADVNAKIRAGQLKTTAGHQVYDPTSVDFNIQWNWTGKKWNWWGMSYWYSEYWTQRIEAYSHVVGDVAALCAFIAAIVAQPQIAIICGLAAAIFTLGADWMAAVDRGGGVVINTTWTPFPYGAAWIWGQ